MLNMPYYLRLLRDPIVISLSNSELSVATDGRKKASHTLKTPSQISVRLILTCTTDLGDNPYNNEFSIAVHLLQGLESRNPIASAKLHWRSGSNVLCETVVFELPSKPSLLTSRSTNLVIWLEQFNESILSPTKTSNFNGLSLKKDNMPEIVSVFARLIMPGVSGMAVGNGNDDNQLVLRRFLVSGRCLELTDQSEDLDLYIWEEMRESIARHIWDAALAMLALMVQERGLFQLILPLIQRSSPSKRLEVLELGSGCGLVSLGLARLLPNTSFTLTDLPEAMDILQKNISVNAAQGFATGTTVYARVLDWNDALLDAIEPKQDMLCPDLILVSDCTYNSSSFEALVATIIMQIQARQRSAGAYQAQLNVLVSYKSRHESELQFFNDMEAAGFESIAKFPLIFPDKTRDLLELELEKAEIIAYRLSKKSY